MIVISDVFNGYHHMMSSQSAKNTIDGWWVRMEDEESGREQDQVLPALPFERQHRLLLFPGDAIAKNIEAHHII